MFEVQGQWLRIPMTKFRIFHTAGVSINGFEKIFASSWEKLTFDESNCLSVTTSMLNHAQLSRNGPFGRLRNTLFCASQKQSGNRTIGHGYPLFHPTPPPARYIPVSIFTSILNDYLLPYSRQNQ